jgi:hypothetical protein
LGAITNFIPPIGDAIKLFLINLNIDTQAFWVLASYSYSHRWGVQEIQETVQFQDDHPVEFDQDIFEGRNSFTP